MNTNQAACPCCGRAFPKAKAPTVVNVAELSDNGKETPATKREYSRLQQLWRESYTPRIVTRKTRSGWIVNQRIAA
jgi:PHP family Zn ribbon phosphoesterase